jgi:hypothetical protein
MRMKSFLIVAHLGWKVQIHIFALKRETSCTYQKEKKLEYREIQESIKASIVVIGDVSPTQIYKNEVDIQNREG